MTSEQLLDSVGVMARLALEAGVSSDDVLKTVQDVCAKSRIDGYTAVVSKVIERIGRDYAQKLTLEGLAKDAFVSRTYLSHLFKKEVGQTLMKYIMNVRVQKSKVHLYNSALTIAEVAKMSGFADAAYYARVFREIEGVPPNIYRLDI
jgi:two-component system response regulator YesN